MDGLLGLNLLGNEKLFGSGGGSAIKSIQRGQTNLTTTTNNVTISAVDLTKSIVKVYPLNGVSANTTSNYFAVRAKLTSTTNLELFVGAVDGSVYASWEVIEFNNVKSLQTGTTSISALSIDVTISPVVLGKSVVFDSYSSSSTDSSLNTFLLSSRLFNTTTLRFEQNGTNVRSSSWFVVEFN